MSQTAICAVTGRGLPLPGNDIDTDRIIPGRFLRCVSFDGLEDHVFEDDRRQNENHPFNQACYQHASILIVGRNFGCGSSREHAPQALRRWGIRGIVGESFAEIFFSNCVATGMPCLSVAASDVQWLMEAITEDPDQEIHLDLDCLTVRLGDHTIEATLPEGARKQFIDGAWNSTQTLLAAGEKIDRVARSLPYLVGF